MREPRQNPDIVILMGMMAFGSIAYSEGDEAMAWAYHQEAAVQEFNDESTESLTRVSV